MTPHQAAAMARLSSFVDSYTTMRGPDPEYVHSIHAGPDGGRSEHIRISDLRTLLAMVSTTPTPGDPK